MILGGGMLSDRILINIDMVPYMFNIRLPIKEYTLTINYNAKHDFYTVALSSNGVILSSGEPIVYGVPLFRDIYRAPDFPILSIVPFDESGEADRVGADNFNKTVFLTIDNGEVSVIG